MDDKDECGTEEVHLKRVGVDPSETGQGVLRAGVDPPETGAVMDTSECAGVMPTQEVEARREAMHKLAMEDRKEVL